MSPRVDSSDHGSGHEPDPPPLVSAGALFFLLLLQGACAASIEIDEAAPSPAVNSPGLQVLACAGPDIQSRPALQVTLDARCSRVIGEPLSLARLWRQMQGPRVTLASAISPLVDLVAPFDAATMIFSYEISEPGLLRRDHAQVQVIEGSPQIAPIAQAGGDRWVDGSVLLLDGRASRSLEAHPLSYSWRQIGGPSVGELGEDALVQANLGDRQGPWLFSLEVHDQAGLGSEPDFVVVRRPDADLRLPAALQLSGPRTVGPGEFVTLPFVEDPDPLTTTSFRVIRGDPVPLSVRAGELRLTAPLRPQTLVIRGDRQRQGLAAAAALAIIEVTAGIGNRAPLAVAGSHRRVRPGLRLVLDGSQSWDPDGDELLSYRWSQAAGPQVELDCDLSACLLDAPDAAARLAFSLIVFDGQAESQPDVIIIDVDVQALNQAPVASAGGERFALPQTTITLDGSQSADPDSGSLASFRWRQDPEDPVQVDLQAPARARLQVTTPASPSLLHFELTVCDADGDCASDTAPVHVEDAGPYVDALLGDDGGDGTALRPVKTVQRGIQIAQRFGFSQLRLAEGDYAPAGDLVVDHGLDVRGGYQRVGGDYQAGEGRSQISIGSALGLQLRRGASLAHINLRASDGLAQAPSRRMLWMGSQTRLQHVQVAPPGPAEESVSVEIAPGSQVLIEDCHIEAGTAAQRSLALRAQSSAEVALLRSRILIGSAPVTLGCEVSDGRLELDDVEIEPGPLDAVTDHSVTGLVAVRSDLQLRASSVRLDQGLSGRAALEATALLCDRCSLNMGPNSLLHGARALSARGRSTGLELNAPVSAQLQGTIVGAGPSPSAQATGLAIRDGRLDALDLDLRAADDAQVTSAIALVVDSAEVQTQRLRLRAMASQVAIGMLLSGSRDMQLDLANTWVEANDAYGVVDGRDASLQETRPATSRTSLSLPQTFSVKGRVEADGLWLTGSQEVRLTARDLQVLGETRARGLRLDATGPVDILDSQLTVTASPLFGDVAALHCAAAAFQLSTVTIRRTTLRASASLSSGLDVAACDSMVEASVIIVDGPFLAQGLIAASQIRLNGVSVRVDGESGAALRLLSGADATVINSVLQTANSLDTALDLRGEIDDLRTLHHVLFAPLDTTLLTLEDQVQASDVAQLDALRARFSALWQEASTGLDASGHAVDASAPVVDRADPDSATLVDVDGQTRPLGAAPDLGADEAY